MRGIAEKEGEWRGGERITSLALESDASGTTQSASLFRFMVHVVVLLLTFQLQKKFGFCTTGHIRLELHIL